MRMLLRSAKWRKWSGFVWGEYVPFLWMFPTLGFRKPIRMPLFGVLHAMGYCSACIADLESNNAFGFLMFHGWFGLTYTGANPLLHQPFSTVPSQEIETGSNHYCCTIIRVMIATIFWWNESNLESFFSLRTVQRIICRGQPFKNTVRARSALWQEMGWFCSLISQKWLMGKSTLETYIITG